LVAGFSESGNFDTDGWKYKLGFNMKRIVSILALVLGSLISSGAWGADKPITLVLEQTTTLRVGDLARLRIPSDSRYLHSGADGPWRDVLVRARSAGHDVSCCAARIGRNHCQSQGEKRKLH
jgi:hypothetical protein